MSTGKSTATEHWPAQLPEVESGPRGLDRSHAANSLVAPDVGNEDSKAGCWLGSNPSLAAAVPEGRESVPELAGVCAGPGSGLATQLMPAPLRLE